MISSSKKCVFVCLTLLSVIIALQADSLIQAANPAALLKKPTQDEIKKKSLNAIPPELLYNAEKLTTVCD